MLRTDMREIQLTQGQVALVDDDQYEYLNQWKWYAHEGTKTFYAARQSLKVNGKQHAIFMHHIVAGYPPMGFETDHRSGRGTDNQRHNLRFVTRRQNQQNQRNGRKKSSKYPGVTWHKRNKRWQAQIRINGKRTYLGLSINEKEAFEIYCQAVEKLGEKMLEGARL